MRGLGRRGGRRVRHHVASGGGAPTPIPETVPGLVEWLDTEETYVSYDGGSKASLLVGRYAGHNFTSSGTARPTWSGSVAALNNNPGLYYTTDDFMECVDGLAEKFDASQPHSIFAVVDRDSDGAAGAILGCNVSGSGTDRIICSFDSAGNMNYVRDSGGSATSVASTAGEGGSPAYVAWFWTPDTVNFTVNGASDGSGSVAKTPTLSQCAIGARKYLTAYANFLSGWVAEILIYDSVLSGANLTSINGYFATKYAL